MDRRAGGLGVLLLVGCGSSPTTPPPTAGPFVAVSAGTSRTCAIKSDGTLWCWGRGAQTAFAPSAGSFLGGLAVPLENVPLAPDPPAVQVALPDPAVAVSVGLFETCAITDQHQLVCFKLPDPQLETLPGTDWASVSVGGASVCAVTLGGAATCWGEQAMYVDGHPYPAYELVDYTQDLGGGWASVTAGPGYTLGPGRSMGAGIGAGVKLDGTGWTWLPDAAPTQLPGMWASLGVLADNTLVGVQADHTLAVPGQAALDGGHDWAAVSAGSSHACATKLDGAGYCWGNADLGRTGTELTASVPTTPLPGTWLGLSAGGTHTCGLQSDGTLWCWGADNTLGGIRAQPTAVPLAGVTQTAVGGCSACAIAGGSLQCWGCGEQGQLGGGLLSAQAPRAVDASHAWTALSLGRSGACAIRDDATLWCWGIIPTASNPQPSPPVELMPGTTGWVDVAVGGNDICATKADHSLFCRAGQVAGTAWAAVATGRAWATDGPGMDERSCALTTGGELWCWGILETAIGTESFSATPVQIAGTWLSLSVTDEELGVANANCAIRSDHTLWCGGGFATQIPGSTWTSVSAASTSCGIQADHSLWCWPALAYTQNVAMPVQIPGAWRAVATRNSSQDCEMEILGYTAHWCPDLCAIADDGSLSCWGVDNLGQVGDSASWKAVPTQLDF